MTPSIENTSCRNATIDFLKFMFALVIVVFHGRKLAFNNEFAFFQSGYLAVEFFFLVSGYLMMRSASLQSEDMPVGYATARFLLHKVKGLYPSILFAFIVTFITILYTGSTPMTWGCALTSIWEISLLRMSGINGLAVNTITWYISAMLISMLFLYPFCIKSKNFILVFAPVIIFIFGYLSQTGALVSPEKWMHIAYCGTFRALAEICLGGICFEIASYLKEIPFTSFARGIFFALLWSCILFSLCIMNIPGSRLDYVCILFLSAAVIISFSGIAFQKNAPRAKKWLPSVTGLEGSVYRSI